MRTVLEVAAVKDVAPLFDMTARTMQNKILPGLANEHLAFGPTTDDGSKWVISADWLRTNAAMFARKGHDVATIPTELITVDLPGRDAGPLPSPTAGAEAARAQVDENAVQVENANLRLELAERALTDAERSSLEQQLLAKDAEIAARDTEIARLQAMVTALTDVVRHAAAPAPVTQPAETPQRR